MFHRIKIIIIILFEVQYPKSSIDYDVAGFMLHYDILL